MIAANELKLDPEWLIVGEPTGKKVVRYQKGILKVRLLAKGRSAHSGYPHRGDSAISKLLRVLHEIEHVAQWPEDELIGCALCATFFSSRLQFLVDVTQLAQRIVVCV
jgi:acetylornithine deacetylase